MCALAVFATVPRWRARLALARNAVKGKEIGAIKISGHIREQAQKTLHIKRAIKDVQSKIEATQASIDSVISNIMLLEQVDPRVYVVDDQRGRADAQWVGMIVHRNYLEAINPQVPLDQNNAWQAGKPCLVWAKTDKHAKEKLSNIFPRDKGYYISELIKIQSETPEKERDDG